MDVFLPSGSGSLSGAISLIFTERDTLGISTEQGNYTAWGAGSIWYFQAWYRDPAGGPYLE